MSTPIPGMTKQIAGYIKEGNSYISDYVGTIGTIKYSIGQGYVTENSVEKITTSDGKATISLFTGDDGVIDEFECLDNETRDTQTWDFLNVDLDGDGKNEPLIDLYSNKHADGSKEEIDYIYNDNNELAGITTTETESDGSQTITTDSDADGKDDTVVKTRADGTVISSETSYDDGGWCKYEYDENGQVASENSFNVSTNTRETITYNNNNPYIFTRTNYSTGEVTYGKYDKNGKEEQLSEEDYKFELENMGKSWFERFLAKIF